MSFSFASASERSSPGSARRMPRLPSRQAQHQRNTMPPSSLPLPRTSEASVSAPAAPAALTQSDWNPFAVPPRPTPSRQPQQSAAIARDWDAPWTGRATRQGHGFSYAPIPLNATPPPLMQLAGATTLRHPPLHSTRQAQAAQPSSASAVGEWSLFGMSCLWDNLHKRKTDLEAAHAQQAGTSDNSQRRPSTAMSFSSDPFDCLAVTFGGERWHLALVHPRAEDAPAADDIKPDALDLYLSCGLLELDYSHSDVCIPVTVHISLHSPQTQLGTRPAPLWELWLDYSFSSPEAEYLKCSFPSLSDLLAQDAVAKDDAVLIRVQIQSPAADFAASSRHNSLAGAPSLRDAVVLPQDMLSALGGLIDDPNSADVRLYVHEQMANSAGQPLYRKRVLLAHSSILRARNSLFKSMLSQDSQWHESAVEVVESSGRKRRVHHIALGIEFKTLYWVLSWLYQDSILFSSDSEEERGLDESDLPDGLVKASDATSTGHLGWDWQTLDAVLGPAPIQPAQAPQPPQPISGGLGRVSPVQKSSLPSKYRTGTSASRSAPASPTQSRSLALQALTAPENTASLDPHDHPCEMPAPASALAIYSVAHFLGLTPLCRLAQEYLVRTLTPSSAFPSLMATALFEELHAAITHYTLQHWAEVRSTSSYERTLQEISEGCWPGNDTLLRFTKLLSPTPSQPGQETS